MDFHLKEDKSSIISEAYRIYREECIELWNFAVMICYAVPTLNKNIKGVEKSIPKYKMVNPDFFEYDNCKLDDLKERIKKYQRQLSSYLWLSNFSYFEAYINRLLDELVEFHGGAEYFLKTSKLNILRDMDNISEKIKKHKIKLQKPYDPRKIDQYKKKTRILNENNYRYPSELFASYGVKSLLEKIDDLRAKDIPTLLQDAFLFNFDDQMIKAYISYKDKRNNIAHGEKVNYSMRETKDMFNFLRHLSFTIDQHLIVNFFVNERYVSKV